MRRDYDRLLKRVDELPGWNVVLRRGGHLRITGPNGAQIFTGSSPSAPTALTNLRGWLRRHGVPEEIVTGRTRRSRAA